MDKKERIFEAAREILGEQGFYGLSIAVVAKKARVAAGTIYRYFSDKDDLLRQLYVHTILQCHPQVMEGVQIEEVSYAQYRRLWLNIDVIFTSIPNALKCKLQYESSPLGAELERDPVIMAAWAPLERFFEQGRQQGLFVDLPVPVLQSLSLDCVANLAQQRRVHDFELTEEQLETVIRASWNAILNPHFSTTGARS
ncbi:TetR/AcrR family transcriptional regulator [Aeromonas taiwanensis]|jgi:TetR/AcrR family transcriptional repressor of multidrug resistance operon|uniref:TetR/AcrR family transcriptional regulator n=1 Tax=Aeromonas taiwanensis TaxID=633417 RepID=A0A5F0K824_9GAMM|nr:TetR/AcrR family transcriptional regulator [Aeromonas taiwanensis]TFF73402.1 TetR/AcrR family transcriptional regulator [Aeromonas taiwanensis]TFF74223.1 TetR/AcrR family transcriptional regulator [Aeromonas taiwanensis]TFF77382.1 TetR/AcrR family transcriptional regulator [Aeromonas taiwanensis]